MSAIQKNRRIFERLQPRGKVRIACHDKSDLGANLALALVDVSETGACMTSKSLQKGKCVRISLEGREHVRPITCAGTVIRCEETSAGLCQTAVLWEKWLPFSEIRKITS